MTADQQRLVVMMPGSRWENTRGTDHRLAEALSRRTSVLWVDPAVPVAGPASKGCPPLNPGYALDGLKPGLMRLRIAVPPGFTRPMIRSFANRLVGRAIRKTLATLPFDEFATILLSPREFFPAGVSGKRILHITDDWVAGAGMMGLSCASVSSTLQTNIAAADIVCVVSPALADLASVGTARRRAVVLPNGCAVLALAPANEERRGAVGLVGQLNERLDFDVLDALVKSGVDIEVIGPRREREATATERLDRFLNANNVTWFGEIPEDEVFAKMQNMAVGITPYIDNEFNRASFPIKTLDYLAAGLPVVSSDLPATRWLNSEWIEVAETKENFVEMVRGALDELPTESDIASRRAFAAMHTWDARAKAIMSLIGGTPA